VVYFGYTQYTLLNEPAVLWKQWYKSKTKFLLHIIKFQMSFFSCFVVTLLVLNLSSVRNFCHLCFFSVVVLPWEFGIDYMLKHSKQQLRQFSCLWIKVFTVY